VFSNLISNTCYLGFVAGGDYSVVAEDIFNKNLSVPAPPPFVQENTFNDLLVLAFGCATVLIFGILTLL
jgi:hypothetical protein